jgi:hypothetical protein
MSQRGHQPGIVPVAGDLLSATRQHDAWMEDVRAGQLHARA